MGSVSLCGPDMAQILECMSGWITMIGIKDGLLVTPRQEMTAEGAVWNDVLLSVVAARHADPRGPHTRHQYLHLNRTQEKRTVVSSFTLDMAYRIHAW